MSRILATVDRVATLLVALLLGAGAFVALDWRFGWVLSYADELSTGVVTDVTDTAWFPWAFAAGAVVLGLIGLWWLLSHARRPHESSIRLRGSGAEGRLEIDLASVADAAAERFAELTPTDRARGRTRSFGSRQVVEVHARLARQADGASLAAAARACADDVRRALPDGDATCRVLVDGPGRGSRAGRDSTARVH